MGKKLGLASLFYKPRDPRAPSSWHWPSCKEARTSSFRASVDSPPELASTDSSFSESSETVIRRLRSDRLFFEPGSTSSIMTEAAKADDGVRTPFEGSMAVPVESEDPYRDFRASMEEMVMAHGVKGWGWLEELLGWYLMVNGRRTHGYILGAFLDLLMMLASSSPSSSSYPNTSCSSTSLSFEIEELEEGEGSESNTY